VLGLLGVMLISATMRAATSAMPAVEPGVSPLSLGMRVEGQPQSIILSASFRTILYKSNTMQHQRCFIRTSLPLLAAAVPALLGSVGLMHGAGVSTSLMIQQAVVFVATIVLLGPALARLPRREAPWPGAPVMLAALLLLPLVMSAEPGPRRWLLLGPFRLYLAPMVIPVLLLLLGRREKARPLWSLGAMLLAGVALLLQPDAAQATALGVALVPLLWSSRLWNSRQGNPGLWRSQTAPESTSNGWGGLRLIVAVAMLLLVGMAWRRPDPLQPVLHVEGVFALAASLGPVALGGAILAAALPSVALFWQARRMRSSEAGAVGVYSIALYYAALLGLAPLQLTPVPLLGFGAGPLTGYGLVTMLVSRSQVHRGVDE